MTNRQTDRHTDRPRYSVCNNMSHLAMTAMPPDKKLTGRRTSFVERDVKKRGIGTAVVLCKHAV